MESRSNLGWAVGLAFAPAAVAANPVMQWAPTPWTALHQWTPAAVNITLLRQAGDRVGNYSARWRILHLTDAHISLGEAPELHQGTRRMHNAFRLPQLDKHWEKGVRRQPAETFRRILQLAEQSNVDAVILGGDIVNFPHNASVQHVLQAVRLLRTSSGARMPVIYTAGNHDWLVEGLPQSRRDQRSYFRRETLRPLYTMGAPRGRRAFARSDSEAEDFGLLEVGPSSLRVGGRRPVLRPSEPKLLILTLDNSMLEVSSPQAEFVLRQLARGLPTLLAVHVPFMLPDTTPANTENVLCGDRRYHHDHDRSWHVERRERWPKTGNPASTLRFVDDLIRRFASPHGPLIGIFGGHEHVHRADALGKRQARSLPLECDANQPPVCGNPQGLQLGLPVHEGLVQYVTPAGFEGGHRIIDVLDSRGASALRRGSG